ncbi:2OG-Fe(II) oxygenase superfamily protein [Saccharata proteae CBS 121410]|uniref:2OG-Fe(II) oxygenase superfamily protein n=1 Tax=Saccharata proteae CBS 121410 TaxID=1314787 RepID=A0A9P4LZU0_9PEZI|nr:2OG-Fe(II) oxygenase superfamily protein [Saccharata proteae CBS 121410]
MASKTKYASRDIPQISLHDFSNRIDDITRQLVSAAENVGFFSLVDHGIPVQDIDDMFDTSAAFFQLPDDVKATVPWGAQNVGWEKLAQIRPSTGAADTKESYQLQFGENMSGLWISDAHVPAFESRCLAFMHRVQRISERLMVCFARGLGFPDDYFVNVHDVTRDNSQSTLRLLHYYALPEQQDGQLYHRAGAHADWGFLTLLFQRAGQSGLEICPGREVSTDFAIGDTWTKVEPKTGDIICNIGDLLMSWSDDRFKSTFHRVKAPCEPGDYYGDRYSIAFFNQPNKDALIQGPLKKYPVITGQDFTANAMKRNFAALEAKRRALAEGVGKEETMKAPDVSAAVSAAA